MVRWWVLPDVKTRRSRLTRPSSPSTACDVQTACKIQARDLVRTRRHIQKFYQMRTQLQAVSLRIQTLRSNQQMAEAMKGATRVSAKTRTELAESALELMPVADILLLPEHRRWAQ
jgi:division protein CdvB (Snf7/Vps24/ESCRT-III family)